MPLTSSNPRIAWSPADPSGGGGDRSGPRVQRPLVPGIPSRRVDPSGVVTQQPRHQRPNQEQDSRHTVAEEGELVVGQGITVKGAIRNCNRLVVHGTVQATIPAQALEVGPEGVVEGSCEVSEATVAGQFDGDLVVDGSLTVAPGGLLKGRVRYRALTVEPGGHISAEIDHIDTAPLSATPEAPAPADEVPETPAPSETEDAARNEAKDETLGVPPAFEDLSDLTAATEAGAQAAATGTEPDGTAADASSGTPAQTAADEADEDAERFYRSLARTSARA